MLKTVQVMGGKALYPAVLLYFKAIILERAARFSRFNFDFDLILILT
jgi:hypothetical protein